ncbi:MAG: acyltransferase [Verrucomicrobiaceae bacterium]|nr:MAG: acyltransferase [Verrucomicrobiaceae bacterium]
MAMVGAKLFFCLDTIAMRNLGLDLLRLVAVLLVLGRHLHLAPDTNPLVRLWHRGGWVGVDLFFVLSGFLVSGLLFKEYQRTQSLDLKRFLFRRGFKIYPAFYVMILVTIGVNLFTGHSMTPRAMIAEFLFFQNYLGGLWEHTWSLAVEEHFYFGIAVLCFVVLRASTRGRTNGDPFRVIPLVFAATALICQGFRIANLFIFENYSNRWFLFGTHLRIDSLMFGVLLSYLWYFRNLRAGIEKLPTAAILAIGILLLSPAFIYELEQFKFVPVFGVVLFYLGSGFMVLASLRLKESSSRLAALLGSLGAASYSIYLWHMPVMTWGWAWFSKIPAVRGFHWYLAFCVVGSLTFGWVMSKLIEWPVLRIRDRWFPSTVKQAEPSQSAEAPTTGAVPDL